MPRVFADLRHRFRAIFRRRAVERELAAELQFHQEQETEKHLAAGYSRAEAARTVRLTFGGVEQIREAHRDARGIRFVESVSSDIRQGLRMFRRAPAFAATIVITIAVAVGALATVAALAETLFLRPLPIASPDRAVVPYAIRRERPNGEGLVSYPDYLAFRNARTLETLAAHYPTAPLFADANGHATEVNGAIVSANYFALFDAPAELGRYFHPDEDAVPDRDRVAVVGHTLWRDWFGGSREVLGSTIRINGTTFTIVGVAPPALPSLSTGPAQIYLPTMSLRVGYRWCNDALAPDCTVLRLVGRIAPGHTIAEAQAELSTLVPEAWRHAAPGDNTAIAVVQPRGIAPGSAEQQLLAVLGGAALIVLLACCANLAGLQAANAAARQNEFATRAAIGAGASRIARQLVTESTILAAIGGVVSIFVSRAFVSILDARFYSIDAEGHPLQYGFHVSTAVSVGCLIAALVAGVLFSAVPALRIARTIARGSLQARRGQTRWLGARGILAVQATVAIALAAVAGLLGASAENVVGRADFDASHVALMRLRPRLVQYAPARAQQFQRSVVARLSTLSGVESVSMTGVGAVLSGGSTSVALPRDPAQTIQTGFAEVGPRYFETLRTAVMAGREFRDDDTTTSMPVAIVSSALAARLWPNGDALGAQIVVDGASRNVVGIVADVQLQGRNEPVQPFVYTPYWQNAKSIDARLCIRVAGDPAAALPALIREIHAVDPDVPIAETITLATQVTGDLRPVRLGAAFVGFTAIVAVMLTVVGLFGSLAFAVATRTKDLAIQLALGAARRRLVAGVITDGLRVVAVAAVPGVALAAAGARMVSSLLFRSAPPDWHFYVAAVALVAGAALVASWFPARRAARIQPILALRGD